LSGPAADFALDKQGRTALLSCKRWKAARQGLEPLRELEAARQSQQVDEAIYACIVELTENAQRFATEKGMRVLQGATLAQMLGAAVTPAKAAA
jgi:restriction system protein